LEQKFKERHETADENCDEKDDQRTVKMDDIRSNYPTGNLSLMTKTLCKKAELKQKYVDQRLATFNPRLNTKQRSHPQLERGERLKDKTNFEPTRKAPVVAEEQSKDEETSNSLLCPTVHEAQAIDERKTDLHPKDSDDHLVSISLRPVSSDMQQSISRCRNVSVNGNTYIHLDSVLGKGASSSVCRVLSSTGSDMYAYKKVDMRTSNTEELDEVLESFTNEISLLKKCKGSSYIIDLIDSEVNREKMFVSLVMEMGEVDLATSIAAQKKFYSHDNPTRSKVNPYFMRLVWERMLLAVDFIHSHRIVHGDLKPANFVFVKGQLKLIDFGISRQISSDTTNIVRSGLVGTVNYMAPEAVMPFSSPEEAGDSDDSGDRGLAVIKHGRASDIWSLGCILYQMLYGKTPFSSYRNTHQKVAMITNPQAEIQFPPIDEFDGIDSAKKCLIREPSLRASIQGERGLLAHPFLTKSCGSTKKDQGMNTDDIDSPVKASAPSLPAGTGVTRPQVMHALCSVESK
jgi:serine/threonine-protein kinase TTK/MPS1